MTKDRREQQKILEYSISEGTDLTQYTFEDYRIYTDRETGKVFVSVTTVLDEIKPDQFLQMWKDKNGSEAVDQVLRRASESGTRVHNAIEQLCELILNGEQEPSIYLIDEEGRLIYSEEEWKGIMRFVDFYNNYVDMILMSESRLRSDRLQIAGTVDGVFVLKDGRGVIIDYKFSNGLSDKYSAQTWAYREMYHEMNGVYIENRANLWLKAHTRGYDKTGKKIQGDGWQLVFHTEDERDEKLFMCAHGLFFDRYRNKELLPLDRKYPTKLTIK
jgi:hypothetical protein